MELTEFLQHNWIWAALAGVSGSLLIFPMLRGQLGGAGISPAMATQLINREDALVIDVREANEWSQGHIPNARHIPLGQLDERLAEINKFKERTIVVNCRSGQRSGNACGRLRKAGFAKVFNLDGGMQAWEQAGLPISKK